MSATRLIVIAVLATVTALGGYAVALAAGMGKSDATNATTLTSITGSTRVTLTAP